MTLAALSVSSFQGEQQSPHMKLPASSNSTVVLPLSLHFERWWSPVSGAYHFLLCQLHVNEKVVMVLQSSQIAAIESVALIIQDILLVD